MSLFCFWYRRSGSHYIVQGLQIPSGSRVEKHLCGCSDCRGYLTSLELLASDLDSMISVPRPSSAFVEPVWEHVPKYTKSARRERLTLAVVGACGLACGWIVWRTVAHQPKAPAALEITKRAAKSPDDPPLQPLPNIRGGGSDRTSQEQASIDAPPAIRVAPPTGRVRHRGRSLILAKRSAAARERELARRINDPATLRASGLILESHGDPGLANVAYQAAYQRQPSEDTAFDVGRTAEASGDMEQAMDVYAGLLDSADARSRNGKGWTP